MQSTHPSIEPLRLMVAIMERGHGEQIASLFPPDHTPLLLVLLGRGTAKSELLDYLGLEHTQKDIVLALLPRQAAGPFLSRMAQELQMSRPGGGIAFTIPLTSITRSAAKAAMNPASPTPDREKEKAMNTEEKYELIVVVAHHGYSDPIMDTARAAGATGGTVLHARALGSGEAQRFIKITIQPEKELIMILAAQGDRARIMQAICAMPDFTTRAKGMIFSVPAGHVVGLGPAPTEAP